MHSNGEYVFDWAWADAWHRNGLRYYPKLTAAIPFTPATGARLMCAPGLDESVVRKELLRGALSTIAERDASGLHYLFVTPDEAEFFRGLGFAIRHGFQFHWKNRGYRDFKDFLAALKPRAARQIQREREQFASSGVRVEILNGESLRVEHADVFYRFYLATITKMHALPYLTPAFFRAVFADMPEQIILILGREGDTEVGAALFYCRGDALYGRYWGATKDVRNMHFELCYYRALEWAIERKIQLFEAGAQGEHKLARGFLPELTRSAHWIVEGGFRDPVAQFVAEEAQQIANAIGGLSEKSPYAN